MTSRGLIRPYESHITVVQRLMDGVWIALAYALSAFIYGELWDRRATTATAVAIILFGFVGEIGRLYRPWRTSSIWSECRKVALIWAVVAPGLLFLGFAAKESANYSRVVTTLWFVLAPILVSSWRVCVRLFLRRMRRHGYNQRNVAIVGGTELGHNLAKRILGTPWSGMTLVGWYDDRSIERCFPMPDGLGPMRGRLDQLVADARLGMIDHVYIALPLRAETRINFLVRELADTTASVHIVANFFVFDLLHAQWSNVYGLPVVSVYETPFFGVNGWLKRVEDLVLGSLILALIAIPMALIALGVKLSSPGPVFFRQRRYGLNGEEIRVLKFRTMTVCEDGPSVKQAQKNDARITRFGAILRRTSLDELPQFLNVITGEMSIVGPRPHAVAHNEQYRRLIHGYMLRHKVKPGITGWAQVNGWRGETDTLEKMQKRIEHDLHYIENWDLFLDLRIIFMTVFGSGTRRNAY